MAVEGGDGDGVAQAQVIELIHVRVLPPGLVGLVHRQHHRLAGAQEHVGHLLIGGGHARFDVAHKDDDGGRLDGDLRLLPHKGQDLVVGARLDTAGVHNVKHPVAPLALGIQPVPGDAGGVLHNGQPLAAQLVEQHGLAHVGPSHNGY